MWSADCFNLNLSKICRPVMDKIESNADNKLTLYQINPAFNDPKMEALETTLGKGENAVNQYQREIILYSDI